MVTTTWRERVQALPRDTRDTLFHLGVIGTTLAPHLVHLPLWCAALVSALLIWRGVLAWRAAALPGRWTVTALLLLAVALTLWQERTLLGRDAGLTLLAVLMSLKTLELRARRDALVVFFLGFFLVLTAMLHSQSLLMGLWMLAAVWGLLTALVLAHLPVGRPPLWQAGAQAARAAALGIPVMLVLFLLFPRIGPLWGLPQDAAGRTGLSGSLRLGGVATIAEDDSIALRIRFDGPPPPAQMLYFRGPVLSDFDGREWTRPRMREMREPPPPLALQRRGAALPYEMTLEPSRLPLLPLLELTPDSADAAPTVPGWRAWLRSDGQWQLDRPLSERVRLRATAWPAARHGPLQPVSGLRAFTALPRDVNPRSLQWAQALRLRPELAAADPRALAEAVLAHIRSAEFIYTLEPGSYGLHAIDEFWFERRLGFCEHFAAAFVVMMRAMDVPARIVTGYQGADALPQDGWWIVRQSNAHAWAEIWQPGEGWLRVDPTAAVAPERVQRGLSLPRPPGLMGSALATLDPALSQRLRAAWETLNNRWNQWVLNYARSQQFDLLRALGFDSPSWTDLLSALAAVLVSTALGGAGWALWDRFRQDPWLRLQQRVQARLHTLGVAVAAHDPPRRRAALVRQHLPQRGEPLAQALEALDRQRYGGPPDGRPDPAWWRQFKAAAAQARARAH